MLFLVSALWKGMMGLSAGAGRGGSGGRQWRAAWWKRQRAHLPQPATAGAAAASQQPPATTANTTTTTATTARSAEPAFLLQPTPAAFILPAKLHQPEHQPEPGSAIFVPCGPEQPGARPVQQPACPAAFQPDQQPAEPGSESQPQPGSEQTADGEPGDRGGWGERLWAAQEQGQQRGVIGGGEKPSDWKSVTVLPETPFSEQLGCWLIWDVVLSVLIGDWTTKWRWGMDGGGGWSGRENARPFYMPYRQLIVCVLCTRVSFYPFQTSPCVVFFRVPHPPVLFGGSVSVQRSWFLFELFPCHSGSVRVERKKNKKKDSIAN